MSVVNVEHIIFFLRFIIAKILNAINTASVFPGILWLL